MAPRDVVIIQDPMGLSERVRAMYAAHPNVIAVAPAANGIGYCRPSDPPADWLPDREDIPEGERAWFKADAMGLSAVVNYSIDADFYWFIEADVVATQKRWKSFFETFSRRKDDCLCLQVNHRDHNPALLKRWIGAPEGAEHSFIMAIYRLSREMVERSIQMAPEMRNVFSEVAVPWVVETAGKDIGWLTEGGHYMPSTISTRPNLISPQKEFINHPVKANTFEP